MGVVPVETLWQQELTWGMNGL